jgi:hypothetical protein
MQIHETDSTIEAYSNESACFIIALCRLYSSIGTGGFDPLLSAGVSFDLSPSCRTRLVRLAAWSQKVYIARKCTQEDTTEGRELMHELLSRLVQGGLGSEDRSTSMVAYIGLLAITPSGWKEPRYITPMLAKLKYMVRATVLTHVMGKAVTEPSG